MLTKSQIIVLHTIKHGDNSLVVQCYSNIAGRQSLYLRGSSKHPGNMLRVHKLNILDVVTYSNNPQSMPLIKELSAPYNLGTLRSDIYKSSIAIFISELLSKCIKESESNPQLYSFISSSIQILEHSNSGIANFHIHFITHLSKMLGFMPLDNYNSSNNIFNIASAKFCTNPSAAQYGSFYMGEIESKMLHALINTPSTNIDRIICNNEVLKINSDNRNSYTKSFIEYLSHHMGNPIEIKSLDILHQVFA